MTAGNPLHGLRLIRDASARLPTAASATARAWLSALDAVALAHLGDSAAWRVLDDADRHADASVGDNPVWPWVFRFDHHKIAHYRVVVGSRLGRLPSGTHAAAPKMTGRSPKQTAVALVEHARALAAGGEIDESCRLAGEAHRLGLRYGSERVRVAVQNFRNVVAVDNPAVRDLDDQMFDIYREQP